MSVARAGRASSSCSPSPSTGRRPSTGSWTCTTTSMRGNRLAPIPLRVRFAELEGPMSVVVDRGADRRTIGERRAVAGPWSGRDRRSGLDRRKGERRLGFGRRAGALTVPRRFPEGGPVAVPRARVVAESGLITRRAGRRLHGHRTAPDRGGRRAPVLGRLAGERVVALARAGRLRAGVRLRRAAAAAAAPGTARVRHRGDRGAGADARRQRAGGRGARRDRARRCSPASACRSGRVSPRRR